MEKKSFNAIPVISVHFRWKLMIKSLLKPGLNTYTIAILKSSFYFGLLLQKPYYDLILYL